MAKLVGIITLHLFTIHISCVMCEDFLRVYSPKDTSISDVIVKNENESLRLECVFKDHHGVELILPTKWYYAQVEGEDDIVTKNYTFKHITGDSSLYLYHMTRERNMGFYTCETQKAFGVTYNVTKYLYIQEMSNCNMRGAFQCPNNAHCVMPPYVCDGFPDCPDGMDELPVVCGTADPCQGKLNCSDQRCIPQTACCDRDLYRNCPQPHCCDEMSLDGFIEKTVNEIVERKKPEDLGFIQTTIYTVTACALVFMIAIILLVTAICKMHMKRNSACMRPPPPGYRAYSYYSRGDNSPPLDENGRPIRFRRFTSNIFRYQPIPQTSWRRYNYDVPATIESDYRFEQPETCARDLNTAIDFYVTESERNRSLGTVDRLLSRFAPDNRLHRPLTLQLGRLQVNIPRFTRDDPRPDTPNVTEIDINGLDFVRFNDTYTLNGRTIRLLGGDFENYPSQNIIGALMTPPPYSECIAKVVGPPPVYLSRESLTVTPPINQTRNVTNVSNVELPPVYDNDNDTPPEYVEIVMPYDTVYEVVSSDTERNTADNEGNVAVNGANFEVDEINTSNRTNASHNGTNVADDGANVAVDGTNVAVDGTNVADDGTNVADDGTNVASIYRHIADVDMCSIDTLNNNDAIERTNGFEVNNMESVGEDSTNNISLNNVIDNQTAVDNAVSDNGNDDLTAGNLTGDNDINAMNNQAGANNQTGFDYSDSVADAALDTNGNDSSNMICAN